MADNDGKTGSRRYADAGVDIDAGNRLVDLIRPAIKGTMRSGADGTIGGFGGVFDLKAAGFSDPLLVSATDGVGTKLRIAIETGKLESIGIDLVAMCVNDLVVQGAEPLFFLDYYATGRLDADAAAAVVSGIAAGCREAGAALVGGETAEMPGMYHGTDFDLAGFAVGAVERDRLLPRSDIASGDTILGLASSGIHSNGYSLVRRIVADAGLAWDSPAPFEPSHSIGEVLLTPTRVYVRPVLEALRASSGIKALAHITGGGITENLPRVLPRGLKAEIDRSALTFPAVFEWLAETGPVDTDEMLRTFNCGIGMMLVVDPDHARDVARLLGEAGEDASIVGQIVDAFGAPPSVSYV